MNSQRFTIAMFMIMLMVVFMLMLVSVMIMSEFFMIIHRFRMVMFIKKFEPVIYRLFFIRLKIPVFRRIKPD